MNFAIVLSCSVVMGLSGCSSKPVRGEVVRVAFVEHRPGFSGNPQHWKAVVRTVNGDTLALSVRGPYEPGDPICVQRVRDFGPSFWQEAACMEVANEPVAKRG